MSEHCSVPESLTYEIHASARTKNSNIIIPNTCALVVKNERDQVVGRYYFTIETTATVQSDDGELHIPKQMILNLIKNKTTKPETNGTRIFVKEVICPT